MAPVKNRNDGLRIKLSKLAGHTKNKALLKAPYYFQCPPMDEFGYDISHSHARYATIDGEYSRRGGANLITVSFRTLVVELGAFVMYHAYDFNALVGTLQDLAEDGDPFRFIATHQYNDEPELEMTAVLESVRVSEVSGETDTRYLDLSFLEWRDPVSKRKKKKGDKHKRKGKRGLPFTINLKRDGSFRASVEHKINHVSGPLTLEKIARYAYGKPSWAKHVAAANRLTNIGPNSPLINHPRFKGRGGKITVPDIEIVGTVIKGSMEAHLGND